MVSNASRGRPDAPMLELAKARILVTNDDGIHAPGLKLLERVAKQLARGLRDDGDPRAAAGTPTRFGLVRR
jgi:hypothetical protein